MKHKAYIIFLGVVTLFVLCFFPIYEMVRANKFTTSGVTTIFLSVMLIAGILFNKLVVTKK